MDIFNKEYYRQLNLTTKEINIEATKVVYQNRIQSLFAVFVVSLLPLYLEYEVGELGIGLTVNSLLWIYLIISYILCSKFNKKSDDNKNIKIWEYIFYGQHIALAILFNIIFMALYYLGIDRAPVYLIIVIISFSAGSVGAFHQLRWAPPLFVTAGMIPAIIFTRQSYLVDNSISFMLILFILFMSMTALKQHKNWALSLAIRKELENSKRKAEHLSKYDSLTDLYNRRAFEAKAQAMFQKSRDNQSPLVISLMDIDYFKNINDEFGHLVGDQVLVKIGEILKDFQKDNIVVGRYGGEEFIIGIQGMTLGDAFLQIESLRMTIKDLVIPDYPIHITASFGIAEIRKSHKSYPSMINDADKALYKAKNEGRNRCITTSVQI